MSIAFLFPGQGSQYVGMGKDIYEKFYSAKDIFDKANKSLEFSISNLCFLGPEEELKKTENTQPSVLTHSIAVFDLLTKNYIIPDIVAGHSVGEYSALVAAGALEFSDALQIVRIRGRLMAKFENGSMLAVLGLSKEEVHDICFEVSKYGIIEPSNFNCPGQIVVSGEIKAIKKAIEIIKTLGKGKTIELAVSGAFHSSLMSNAENEFIEYLKNLNIKPSITKIIANFNADYVTTPEDIKESLAKQISRPVRWHQTIERMLEDGVDKFIEVGPGKVLSGLMKRIKKDVFIANVEDTDSLNKTLKLLEV